MFSSHHLHSIHLWTLIHLFLKWTTIVSIIHIGVQGPKTVCVHIVSALPAIFAPLVAATENRDFSLP